MKIFNSVNRSWIYYKITEQEETELAELFYDGCTCRSFTDEIISWWKWKLDRWTNHFMVKVEAGSLKKSQCNWKRDWCKYQI